MIQTVVQVDTPTSRVIYETDENGVPRHIESSLEGINRPEIKLEIRVMDAEGVLLSTVLWPAPDPDPQPRIIEP